MKQLEQQVLEPENIEIVNQKEVKKELKFLGRLKLQPGQHLWELDLTTKMINKVVFDTTAIELNGAVRKKHVIKENCFYVPAINVKNAEKKFIKMLA